LTVQSKATGQSEDKEVKVAALGAMKAELAADRYAKITLNYDNWMPKEEKNTDGSSSFTILTGTYAAPFYQGLRFFPAVFSIHVGDTVIFDGNNAYDPHIVAFGGKNGFNPTAIPGSDLATDTFPYLTFNPVYFQGSPTGGSYDGVGLYHSPFIAAPAIQSELPPGSAVINWSVKLTAPGIYYFACPLHQSAGMLGYITVLA